jgi:cytochrome c oxidase assembly protein subunit 11
MANTTRNKRTFIKVALISVLMFGFGYLLVPLYDVFCEITGLNGKTGRVETAEVIRGEEDLTRTVTVQFVANHNASIPWDLAPVVTSLEIHPGKLYSTHFIAHNRSAIDRVAQAVPSVAPTLASRYFNKTECFCFSQQSLKSGETKEMPLRFTIDPKLPKKIQTITLAYTLFDVTEKAKKP